ncbi:MAG: hypothetical protein ABSE45_09810 [Candidatus Acidiferrales bacterium]|jgi:hypothetical protein
MTLVLRRASFVRMMESELQRRGYVRTTQLPNAPLGFRRSLPWVLLKFNLRVEIHPHHVLRFVYSDGRSENLTAKDVVDALKMLDAAEISAEFGRG